MAARVQEGTEFVVISEANEKVSDAHLNYVLNKKDLWSERLFQIFPMDFNRIFHKYITFSNCMILARNSPWKYISEELW